MFKQILRKITKICGMEEYNIVSGEISRAFDTGKISWSDYNLLHDVLALKTLEMPEFRK